MRGEKQVGGGAGRSSPWPSPHDSRSALINPQREPGEAPVASRVVLAFTRPEAQLLGRLLKPGKPRQIWSCVLRDGLWEGRPLTVAGPAVGAPYTALVLEKLFVLGARAVVALGWCGSLQPAVRLGSLVLPESALGQDGTSPHYRVSPGHPRPHPGLSAHLVSCLEETDLPWHRGVVWTTDAFYRETLQTVQHYQNQGVLAVDLEMAAVFAVGEFRGLPVAGLLTVSDELFTLKWRSGQRSPAFKQARQAAALLALTALTRWEVDDA